jgi:hypothetical protein
MVVVAVVVMAKATQEVMVHLDPVAVVEVVVVPAVPLHNLGPDHIR